MAAASACPDVHAWITNLPPSHQWKQHSISKCIYSSCSSHPSLKLSAAKTPQSFTSVTFSIIAEFSLPISLWTSKPMKIRANSIPSGPSLLDHEAISALLMNLIQDIITYGGSHHYSIRPSVPKILDTGPINASYYNFKDVFNLAFLTLSLLVCIYEAPADLRAECLATLKNQLSNCHELREASKSLMKVMGSNLEEQWMRSVNLAITNWIAEEQVQAATSTISTPSPLFSYSFSTSGLWKVQIYCPVIAMDVESSSHLPSSPERLLFSLKYHQLEGVIQFNYRAVIQENWIDVIVNTDNIRCDVVRLVNETLLAERGVGMEEKHFPSRISLHLTPIRQSNIISVSVSKSSENPGREIGLEKGVEASIDPPNTFLGLKVSAGESVSASIRPWKFEESVYGYTAILNWFLHDTMDGKEVFASKPSAMALMKPKAWFKDRYSSAYRPFTRQGGVIFAGDEEYGKSVRWKVDKSNRGKSMEWEMRGWIWVTYWPNKHQTLFSETRRLQFSEILPLTIP